MTDSLLESRMRRILTEELAAALQVDTARIESHVAFSAYGLDSILSAGFIRNVNRRLQIELDVTAVFDHHSVERLGAHIAARDDVRLQAESRAEEWLVPAVKSGRRRRSWRRND